MIQQFDGGIFQVELFIHSKIENRDRNILHELTLNVALTSRFHLTAIQMRDFKVLNISSFIPFSMFLL